MTNRRSFLTRCLAFFGLAPLVAKANPYVKELQCPPGGERRRSGVGPSTYPANHSLPTVTGEAWSGEMFLADYSEHGGVTVLMFVDGKVVSIRSA